jgi:hypothetical protein
MIRMLKNTFVLKEVFCALLFYGCVAVIIKKYINL